MFLCPDADWNESNSIARVLGMSQFGWRQSTDIMIDLVIESMQEIVGGFKREQRGLFLSRYPRKQLGDTEYDLQATSCSRTSGTGFHLQTRGGTITSPVNLGIVEPELGGLKVTLI